MKNLLMSLSLTVVLASSALAGDKTANSCCSTGASCCSATKKSDCCLKDKTPAKVSKKSTAMTKAHVAKKGSCCTPGAACCAGGACCASAK